MEDPQPSPPRKLARAGNNSMTEYIPHDVTLEILSKLPPKSLIRFQSVSNLWSSTIRSKDFTSSFLNRSRSCPCLLIAVKEPYGKFFIFSAPEYKDNHDDKSSTVLARHDMTVSDTNIYHICSPPVNGFLCCISGDWIEVCNPTTKQRVKLPAVDVEGAGYMFIMDAYLGYDPVEDQYKVLCIITFDRKLDREQEHLVCTVCSGKKLEWRKIHTTATDTDIYPRKGTFMGGVIYYCVGRTRIAGFDVRSEKINYFIQAPGGLFFSELINYQGKLAVACFSSHIRLWILQDAEKQEWSSVMTCDVPLECRLSGHLCAGEIRTKEVLMIPSFRKISCVCYCNMITKSITRVKVDGIDGIDDTYNFEVFGFSGYVENITFL